MHYDKLRKAFQIKKNSTTPASVFYQFIQILMKSNMKFADEGQLQLKINNKHVQLIAALTIEIRYRNPKQIILNENF